MQMSVETDVADPDLELVGRLIDAFNGDDLDALLELLHPDVTVIPAPVILAPGTVYHGHDGYRSMMADVGTTFSSVRLRPQVVRRVNQQVMTVWTAVGRRRRSSSLTSLKAVHLISCEDGLIRRLQGFRSELQAVAAAHRQQPVVVVERYLAAIRRRDAEGMIAECHPDVQIFPSQALVPAGTAYRGHDGIRSMVAGYDRWRYFAVESEELREAAGRVETHMVVVRGRSRETAERHDLVVLHTLEDDKIRLIEGFSRPHGEPDPAPSGDEYRTLFDALRDPAFLVDDDCRMLDANAAAEQHGLGTSRRGRLLADLVPGLPMLRGEAWQRVVEEGQLCHDFGPDGGLGDGEPGELRVKANFLAHRHLVIIRTNAGGRVVPEEPLLTPREREIFRLLALGLSGRDIARQLFLSPDTVRTHVQNGVARLGAHTRGQAIAIALTRGEIAL